MFDTLGKISSGKEVQDVRVTNGQKSVKNAEEVEDHDQIIKKNQPQVRRRKVENVKRVK